ncbi:DUF3592 domain-containing protein [Streptomyces sp. NPDC046727]|uniref:DUF3592 domain-containing protein n=1 Tax=Streptomyces sp. NPDC046727 TaxID=3155373 RepID=UPI0033D275B6
MTPTGTSPLVLHGRRRRAARLRSGELLWDAAGVRHRIPVAAIARVDVSGPRGNRLTVALFPPATAHPPAGFPPSTYTLTSRSAPAVREFAAAVRRALPARGDAGEPLPGPSGRIRVEPLERPGLEPRRVRWWALGGVYVLVAALLAARRSGSGFLPWLCSPVLVAGLVGVRNGTAAIRDAWVLRTRGITVEGRLERTWTYHHDDGSEEQYVYAYDDTRGVTRTRTGPEGGRERVEIVYDPEDPALTKVGRGPGDLVLAVALQLVFGLPLLGFGLACAGLGLLGVIR